MLPPLALAVTALALAVVLTGQGRRLAATGAVMLAVVALPLLDANLGMVPLPVYSDIRTALFDRYAITPSLSMPQPVPAITAVLEFTAFLLLVAGLTGGRRRTGLGSSPGLRRGS